MRFVAVRESVAVCVTVVRTAQTVCALVNEAAQRGDIKLVADKVCDHSTLFRDGVRGVVAARGGSARHIAYK